MSESTIVSPGEWLQRRRKQLGLTRSQLAFEVGCSADLIKKIERDERRPSHQIAKLLALHLQIPAGQTDQFVAMVRGTLVPFIPAPDNLATEIKQQHKDTFNPTITTAGLTPFLGREREFAAIGALFAQPENRLVTIFASGGMGKTRLARQAGNYLQANYRDGAAFVQLVTAQNADNVIADIARAIHLTFQDNIEPKVQLLNYLRDKQMLLVLDNMEHLLNNGTRDLLVELLQAAAGVQMLVTSREKLRLQMEVVFPITGLTKNEDGEDTAVSLFLSRAQLHDREEIPLADIEEICQLVEGMPLAIELAGVLTGTLTVADILGEIKNNIRVLATNTHDVPDRHQSIRAVYDPCWQRLDVTLQDIVMVFTVFRGGADLDAVKAVTAASTAQLQELIQRSLLRFENGRYVMHELLRQYAENKLVQSRRYVATHQKHAVYYANLLKEKAAPQPAELLNQQLTAETYTAVSDDVDNLIAAWEWFIDTQNMEQLSQFVPAVYLVFKAEKRLREALSLLHISLNAIAAIPENSLVQAQWNLLIADVYVILGYNNLDALNYLKQAAALTGNPFPETKRKLQLGVVRLLPAFLSSGQMRDRVSSVKGDERETLLVIAQVYALVGLISYEEEDIYTFLYLLGDVRNKFKKLGDGSLSLLALTHSGFHIFFNMLGWTRRANKHEQEARRLLQKLSPSPMTLLTYLGLLSGSMGYRTVSGIEEDFRTILAGDTDYALIHGRIFAEVIGGQRMLFRLYQGQFAKGVEDSLETIAYADANYVSYYSVFERGILATCYRHIGELEAAQAVLDQASLNKFLENPGRARFWGMSEQIILHLENGRFAAAEQELTNILPYLSEIPFTLVYLSIYVNIAEGAMRIWEHKGIADRQMEQLVKRTLSILKRQAMLHVIAKPDTYLYNGRYHSILGHRNRAIRSWKKGLRWAQKLDMTFHQGQLYYELGLHASGAEREKWLQQAEQIFTRRNSQQKLTLDRTLLAD